MLLERGLEEVTRKGEDVEECGSKMGSMWYGMWRKTWRVAHGGLNNLCLLTLVDEATAARTAR